MHVCAHVVPFLFGNYIVLLFSSTALYADLLLAAGWYVMYTSMIESHIIKLFFVDFGYIYFIFHWNIFE